MDDNRRLFTLYGKSPLLQLVLSVVIIFFSGLLLLIVLLLAVSTLYGTDFETLYKYISTGSGEKSVEIIRYMVLVQDISFFIVPAFIIMVLMSPYHTDRFADFKSPGTNEVVLVIILTICIIPVTSLTGALNSAMNFPEWMSGVERWMRENENEAARVTRLLIASETFRAVMVNVVIIAVIPAIGEEFIFRGVFQRIISKLFRSGNIAVFVTAIVFSAIHLQFYGFVPRLILGLTFGYLYLWTGNLWLPVISHFINNAVPVFGTYFFGWELVDGALDIPVWKQMIGLPVPIAISTVIFLYFRKRRKIYPGNKNDLTQISNHFQDQV